MSPAPTGPSFANTQQATNFFSGANGVNGIQQQQPFAAPSATSFDFTAPTGTNPFAASTPPNPFSNQNSSNSFGQQPAPNAQQSSIFGQPAASQPSSTIFSAPSNFNFGQSTGINSSFPPTQNTSIFSKSTPAPSSFTFGSNPSFPPQTPVFGAPAQNNTAGYGESMEVSGESPFKRQANLSVSDQTAETKPASPSFGLGTTTFTFKPANNDLTQGQKAQSPQPFGSFFPPKQAGAEQPTAALKPAEKNIAEEAGPTTSLDVGAPSGASQPESKGSSPTESPFKRQANSFVSDQTTETKPASPSFGSGTTFMFKPANNDLTQGQKAQSPQPFGSFFPPKQAGAEQPAAALKPAEKNIAEEAGPTTSFNVGAPSGASRPESKGSSPTEESARPSASSATVCQTPKPISDEAHPVTKAPQPTEVFDPFMLKVKSYGASTVPEDLDDGNFVDYDKSCRLHTLNAKLKKQIAELDPVMHDFEPIIRFYATQRAAIGYPMGGLYHRVKAGEKRKTAEVDRDEEAPNAAKRAKLDPIAPATAEAARPVFSFSAITSVSTSPQAPIAAPPDVEMNRPPFTSNFLTNVPSTAQPAAATSITSNVFKSMLSSSNQSSFGTQERPANFSPSKAVPAMSTAGAQEPGVQSSAPLMFTSMNNTTPTPQFGTQSNSRTTPFPTSNGAWNTSQLFQPKPAAASTLEPPKFASASGADFMSAFAAQAQKNAAKMEAENKAKRKAEEFDSDEDDEAEYERRAAEEDRAKRAKIEALARAGSGFTPVLSSASSANGASPAAEQDGESNRDASDAGSDRSVNDQYSEPEEVQDEEAERDEDYEEEGQEDEETDEDDDIQTAMAKSHAKAKNPFDSSSDPNSLFSRITRPDSFIEEKGSKADTTSPATQAASNSVLAAPLGTGLFGSRPTTPNHDSPKPFGTSIFSSVGSSTPTGDNTWKPGSAIKFGSPTTAPTVNITPATPLAKTNGNTTKSPFSSFSAPTSTATKPANGNDDDTPKASSSIFGASAFTAQSGASGASTPKTFGSLFGDSKKTTANQSSAAQVGFSFGGPNKPGSLSLLAPSNVSSAITSRATSPGLTDNESAAESSTDDHANDPQSDYMTSRPGEENEDVVFEVRTKVLEYRSDKELSAIGSKEESGWKTRGLGPLRILRNSETGRTRMVMRSEPGANVIINSPLIRDNTYDVNPSGKEGASLKMGIFMNGKLKNWVFKLKTIKIARELVDYLEKNEPSAREGEEA
jgi:RanBP1 domain